MTREEFYAWWEFYKLYPFDDFHRFVRPAAFVWGGGASESMKAATEFLGARDSRMTHGVVMPRVVVFPDGREIDASRYNEAALRSMVALGATVKG